jgi:N-acyl-D-amino-acid deacylase
MTSFDLVVAGGSLDPSQFSAGIGTVIVNGALVVDSETHTGARPGRVIRGRP